MGVKRMLIALVIAASLCGCSPQETEAQTGLEWNASAVPEQSEFDRESFRRELEAIKVEVTAAKIATEQYANEVADDRAAVEQVADDVRKMYDDFKAKVEQQPATYAVSPETTQVIKQVAYPEPPMRRDVHGNEIPPNHWSILGDHNPTREEVIRHLMSHGNHSGKFSESWLRAQSTQALRTLHDHDHEGSVKWSYVPNGKPVSTPAIRVSTQSPARTTTRQTVRTYSTYCPNGRCPTTRYSGGYYKTRVRSRRRSR